MQRIKMFIKQHIVNILLGIVFIMIISLCFQDTINYDEFFSMEWCRWSWKEMWERLISDVHPPLYYILLKLLMDMLGGNMFIARLFSGICCFIMLLFVGKFLEKNIGKNSAVFFVCITFFNPFMIQKATEIRMYLLATVFSLLSGVYTYKLLKSSDNRNWIIFTCTSLLAAYTQYYALFTMCFLYAGLLLYFVIQKNIVQIKKWLVISFITIICYLPWLPIAIKQVTTVNGGYWIPMPSSKLGPLRELFYSRILHSESIYIGIMFLCLIIAFIFGIKNKTVETYWVIVCNSAVWGILVFSIVYARTIRPILVSRYLIMATCLAFLGISYMIKYLNKYVVFLFCCFFAVVGVLRYSDAIESQNNRNTTQLVKFVEENVEKDDVILYVHDGYGYVANCIQYYFPNIQSVSVRENDLQNIENEIVCRGDMGFFDDQNNVHKIGGLAIEDCGQYGFGAEVFELYKISK